MGLVLELNVSLQRRDQRDHQRRPAIRQAFDTVTHAVVLAKATSARSAP